MSTFKDKQSAQLLTPVVDPVVGPREGAGTGLLAVQQLAQSGTPTPDAFSALLSAHPDETNAIVAFAQRTFGNAFLEDAMATPASVDLAAACEALIAQGLTDQNKLTNELFWMRYPMNRGKKLRAGSGGASEWLTIRDKIVHTKLAEPATVPQVVKPVEEQAQTPVIPVTPVHQAAPQEPAQQVAPPMPGQQTAPAVALDTEDEAEGDASKGAQFSGKPTTKEEAKVLKGIRDQVNRFDPEWLMEAQKALGVSDANGAFDTGTLRAMRAESGKPKLGASDIMKETFLADKLPKGDRFLSHGATTRKDAPAKGANTEFDQVAQAVGYASYDAWKDTWGTIKLLGKTIGQGHPHIVSRVQAAEAFLRANHEGETDAQILTKIAWDGTGNGAYFHDGLHMHSMGMALDITPRQNPYIFRGGKATDGWYERISEIATQLYGGQKISAAEMMKWSQEESTEEMYAKIKAASDAIEKYMALVEHKDKAKIRAALEEGGFKGAEVDDIVAKATAARGHWDIFHDKDRRQTEAKSITNIGEEMVIALRDAGGLAWGGVEMSGNENGDFMHFDCRFDGFGSKVYSAIRRVKAATAAAKKDD